MDQRGPMEVRMRIQDRYFCFSVASFLAIFTMLYMFFATPLSNMPGTITWGFFSALAICVFVYNVYKTILWHSRARRFKYHFGTNPPADPHMDWKDRLAIQPIVDKILESRAGHFADSIAYENVALEKMPTNTIAEAEYRAKEIFARAEVVERRKKNFWMLHNLAFEWGFEVYDSHLDYTSPLSRAGKEKRKKKF